MRHVRGLLASLATGTSLLVLLGSVTVSSQAATSPALASATPAASAAASDSSLGSWSPLRAGVTGPVQALALLDDTLYVGGAFTRAGDDSANYIAAWADDTWSPLGTGTNSTVYALAAVDDTLYAGGAFSTAGGVGVSYVAAWSNDAWSALDGGVSGGGNIVYALAVQADDTLYVGGNFTRAGISTDDSNVAAWSAGAWSSVGLGTNGGVESLATTDDTVFAGGAFTQALPGAGDDSYISAWSGGTWSPLVRGLETNAGTLAVIDDTIFAGGTFYYASGVLTPNIAAWSDDTWQALGPGLNSPVRAIAVDKTRGLVYAGGQFAGLSTQPQSAATLSHIAVWDMGISAWIPFQYSNATQGINADDTLGNQYVSALAVDGASIYAGGNFDDTSTGSNNIGKWTWQEPQGANEITNLPVTLEGKGFIGVPATGGVTVGGAIVTYTRDDSAHITITSGAGAPYGSIRVNGVGGWGTVGTYSNPTPPPPPTPIPPSPPRDLAATAGESSGIVTWAVPQSSGSFPVTDYRVTATPGGQGCLTSLLTCRVDGLTPGTTYTFAGEALSGAGWSIPSLPSNAVTPTGPAVILITGSRGEGADLGRVYVSGSTSGLEGSTVRARVRLAGQAAYAEGAQREVAADGGFAWSRKTGKKTYVYFEAPAVEGAPLRSNRVIIPAR